MKAPKQIKLDQAKLLGYRKGEAAAPGVDVKTLKRLHSAMVGAKPGIKPASPQR
jgi:hypothetical protein